MPVIHVSEIDIRPDSEKGTGPLYVNLPNGTQVIIWPSGNSLSIRVPMYDGQEPRYMEEIEIDMPAADQLQTLCNQTDAVGNFTVTATHRH